jgi:hypothetical protein
MPYMDSVWLTEEQEQAIKARAKKMNAGGVRTFADAAAAILMRGVEAMDVDDAQAAQQAQQDAGQVKPAGDPLAAMTGQ